MGTASNMRVGVGTIYIGTAGAWPTTAIGFTGGPFSLNYSPTVKMISVHELTTPVRAALEQETVAFEGEMAEPTLANIKAAMAGGAIGGGVVTVGGGTLNTISVRIDQTVSSSITRTLLMVRAVPMKDSSLSITRVDKTVVPVRFECITPTGNFTDPFEMADWKTSALSAEALTLTASQYAYIVDSELGGADTLTTISGGSSGDVITLRIASTGEAITVTDNDAPGAGQINLTDSGNFTMNNMLDRLVLTKHADGYWEETSRINA